MSHSGNLSRQQKTQLLRALIEMANDEDHIDATCGEIAARLSERIGRGLSTTTTRHYLRDGGFTWSEPQPRQTNRTGAQRTDRISQLAKILEDFMLALDGVGTTPEMLDDVHRLATKRPLRSERQEVTATQLLAPWDE